jgi:superfamily I DNA/RNA helicase
MFVVLVWSRWNVPCVVLGSSLSLYRRKEVKDVLAYLTLAVNPHDDLAFKRLAVPRSPCASTSWLMNLCVCRVCNVPTRRFGDTSQKKLGT